MTYEYGVVIRRQRQGRPALWQVSKSTSKANAKFTPKKSAKS